MPNVRQLKHYNSHTAIRGNKLYWHKSGTAWKETDQRKIANAPKQYTSIINPVRKETRFNGRIRFENLSDIELGALLFSLELPTGCLHKLGMGKPLGLGSIKISPRLFLSERTREPGRKSRYTVLSFEWKNAIEASSGKMAEVKKDFEGYMLQQLGESADTSLWNTERLQELETMLNYKKGLERQKHTMYMRIEPKNEFKDRKVLPKPSNVNNDEK